MEPIFTLPYSEFEALAAFNKLFKKKGFATLVPTSRQQAGIDFVVMKAGTRRILRVQVKSSRAYTGRRSPSINFWFKNFSAKYRPGVADLYVFLGVYPAYAPTGPVTRDAWKTIIAVVQDKEMNELLARIKTKGGADDRFFGFGFDLPRKGSPKSIVGNRGALEGVDLSRYLLDHRREEIGRLLEQ